MLICEECFSDFELRAEVKNNAGEEGICEACGNTGKLSQLSDYQDFFNDLLQLYVPSASNEDKLIVDQIQEDFGIFKDATVADKILSEIISNQNPGYDLTTHIQYNDDVKEGSVLWENLKKSVRTQTRFFTSIDELETKNYLRHESNREILKEGSKLYRARVRHRKEEKFRKKDMGCPPPDVTSAGRANPVGIPYLYLSNSPETTYYEVRAVYLDAVAIGRFRIERDLTLINLKGAENIYLAYRDSEEQLNEIVARHLIKKAISRDMSAALRRYDTEVEYVPTQFICEYCKQMLRADGIMFESSLREGGINYVLFNPEDAKCTKVENHEITSVEIKGKKI